MIGVFSKKKSNKLLDANNILRNSCLLAENEDLLLIANLCENDNHVHVALQQSTPFAMVECKRVGVEAGRKKGPQTIEKAKQGAYVAQMTSALQKIWIEGKRYGLIYKGGNPIIKPYEQLLDETIHQQDPLRKFILSIGVVSNHGNWFTSNNKNKEMKVLANAYDWLLFLTDAGLAKCVSAHKNYGADVIALVPVAPNTAHWKRFVFGQASSICFLYDTRLRFLENGKDTGKGAPMACCLVYWGNEKDRFIEHFLDYGATVDISNLLRCEIGIDRKEKKLLFATY